MPFRKKGFFRHLLGFHNEDYLSLYDLSLNAFIQSAWETPQIKTEISNYFKKYDSFMGECAKVKAWHKITKKVLDSISDNPYAIINDCQNGVVYVGEEIYKWTRYVIDELGLDLSYAKKIYWTRHSEIDEEKFFKYYWLNDKKLWKFDNKCPLGRPIYQLACIFAQEEFILQNVKAIMAQLQRLAELAKSPFRIVKHTNKFHEIMNTWIGFYMDGIIDNAAKNKSYQGFHVSSGRISPYGFYSALNKCRQLRFSHVVNYILNCSKNKILGDNFNSLSSADLINYCDTFCKDSFDKYLYYEKSYEGFFLKLFDDALPCERDTLLENIQIEAKFNILKALLRAWPFRKYCQPYFEVVVLPYYKDMFLEYEPFFCYNDSLVFINKLRYLLNFMAYKRRDDFLCGCPVKRKVFEEMLECMWSPIEENDKKRLMFGGIFLEWYYDCLDLDSLKIIDSKWVDKVRYKKMDELAPKSDRDVEERLSRAFSKMMQPKTETIRNAETTSEKGNSRTVVKARETGPETQEQLCAIKELGKSTTKLTAKASNGAQAIKAKKIYWKKKNSKQDNASDLKPLTEPEPEPETSSNAISSSEPDTSSDAISSPEPETSSGAISSPEPETSSGATSSPEPVNPAPTSSLQGNRINFRRQNLCPAAAFFNLWNPISEIWNPATEIDYDVIK